ncbi:MAG: sugar ABC transporter ATP-binding protein [Gemmatimonadota bacterium]
MIARPETTAAPPLLQVTGATKSYAGIRALRHASFTLRAGEIHALIGENGAGKSTFIKLLTGAVQADGGAIAMQGTALTIASPREAKARGIAAIYQQPALFPELSVAENLAIGIDSSESGWRVDWRARRRRAVELLARVGARIDPGIEAGSLSMPEQQLVEIARALGADAKVLILDEPTASLAEDDAHNLFRVMRELRTRGVGMIYISHRLDELPQIADRVTVLRDGETIGTHDMVDVTRERLIQLMVGRDVTSVFPKRVVPIGDTVLELRGLGCAASGVHDVDLHVRAGEIVGVAGLVGAGRTELARVLFGLTPADRGQIALHGRSVQIESPAAAIAHGIAYVPEDRRRHGVVLAMPVAQNITLASLDGFNARGALDLERENSVAARYVAQLGVRTESIFSVVGSLSGGNQQKVALGRWLLTDPKLLILDEPTQGIDVGAKSEIHALMGELAARGVAILMISSELPEVLGMSDRVAVMRGGTVVEVLERTDATAERVLASAFAS